MNMVDESMGLEVLLLSIFLWAALFILGHRLRTVPPLGPVASWLTLGIGVFFVLVVLLGEVRDQARSFTVEDPDTVHRIDAAGEGPIDRLQFILAVHESPLLGPPLEMYERIVPWGQRNAVAEFDVDALGFHAKLRGEGEPPLRDEDLFRPSGRLECELRGFLARHYASSTLAAKKSWQWDPGDGRPFGVVRYGLQDQRTRLSLALGDSDTVTLWVRGLREDDLLSLAPGREVARSLESWVTTGGKLCVASPSQETEHPLGGLIASVNPMGAFLLFNGLLLIGCGRLSWIQTGALCVVAPLVLLSLCLKLRFDSHVADLHSQDPGQRVRAVAHVATTKVFTETAGRVLLEHFDREDSEDVRSASLFSLCAGTVSMVRSGAALEIGNRAQSDSSPEVRRAALRLQDAVRQAEPR